MIYQNKQLLLIDLCARLPYGVKVTWDGEYPLTVTPYIYCAIASEDNIKNLPKLLLRPMSSMTEEENEEYIKRNLYGFHWDFVDWCNSKHLDYRGLIEKGLAIKVTEENNPYKD